MFSGRKTKTKKSKKTKPKKTKPKKTKKQFSESLGLEFWITILPEDFPKIGFFGFFGFGFFGFVFFGFVFLLFFGVVSFDLFVLVCSFFCFGAIVIDCNVLLRCSWLM